MSLLTGKDTQLTGTKPRGIFGGRGPLSIGMMVWLTAVWVLLWGGLSLGNLINGLVLSVVISWLLPLPRVANRFKVRPLAVGVLIGKFVWDVVAASFQVATTVLTRRQPRSAVIRIQLRSHNDIYLTATSGFTTLIPGSVAVEALKYSGVIYVHVLDVDEKNPRRSLREFELETLSQEERILRAFASDDELLDAGYDPGWRCQGPEYCRPNTPAHGPYREVAP